MPKYELLIDGRRRWKATSEEDVRRWLAEYCEEHTEDDPEAVHVQVRELSALSWLTGGKLLERTLFFVITRGAPYDEGEWWSCQLDCEPENVAQVESLRWHCRNSYVLAPPSRDATAGARWLRPPGQRPLPDPVRMLEFLADACDEVNG